MKIDEKRIAIDAIDDEIVQLLNHRTALVKEIAMLKFAAGLPVADAQRESEVLRRLTNENDGVIDDEALGHIYRTILAESRNTQTRLRSDIGANLATRQ